MLDRQRIDRDKLIDLMRTRNVRLLVHFTRAENLASILKSGIVPRANLSGDAIFNDQMRLDGFTEASSLSISFPNYRMFYAYQDKNQNQNWVVIGIHPDVLLDLPCLYFSSNAASSGIRKDDEQALAAQMGVVGLSGMFYENHEIDRSMRGLETNWPTDPQAEVLVFGTIDPRYFMGFAFRFCDPHLQSLACDVLPGLKQIVGGKLFGPRNDWAHWNRPTSIQPVQDIDLEFPYGQ